MKSYWHKIPKEDQKAVLQFSQMTVGAFMDKYQQPPWCNYPEALGGTMGCWSLMIPGKIWNRSCCKNCELLEELRN
jgi:hypothetical protein